MLLLFSFFSAQPKARIVGRVCFLSNAAHRRHHACFRLPLNPGAGKDFWDGVMRTSFPTPPLKQKHGFYTLRKGWFLEASCWMPGRRVRGMIIYCWLFYWWRLCFLARQYTLSILFFFVCPIHSGMRMVFHAIWNHSTAVIISRTKKGFFTLCVKNSPSNPYCWNLSPLCGDGLFSLFNAAKHFILFAA